MNTTKFVIGMTTLVLLMAAGPAQADQICGLATCTAVDSDAVTQGNVNSQANMCTGNIIIQYSGNNSIACGGNNQEIANCQTQGADLSGCGGPGSRWTPWDS